MSGKWTKDSDFEFNFWIFLNGFFGFSFRPPVLYTQLTSELVVFLFNHTNERTVLELSHNEVEISYVNFARLTCVVVKKAVVFNYNSFSKIFFEIFLRNFSSEFFIPFFYSISSTAQHRRYQLREMSKIFLPSFKRRSVICRCVSGL